MDTMLEVLDCEAYTKAYTTNATDTSFASLIPTTTEPVNATSALASGVHKVRREGASPKWLRVVPYGTGDANDVFDMWITGWQKIGTLWVPTRLVMLTCTLGTATGVASAAVTNSELFCDTITATMGISNVSYELYSPTDNTVAHALVKTNGCEYIQFSFDMTTGSPTGANCLFARV